MWFLTNFVDLIVLYPIMLVPIVMVGLAQIIAAKILPKIWGVGLSLLVPFLVIGLTFYFAEAVGNDNGMMWVIMAGFAFLVAILPFTLCGVVIGLKKPPAALK
jgi:hypothetical protein